MAKNYDGAKIALRERIWQEYNDYISKNRFFVSRVSHLAREFEILKYNMVKSILDEQFPIGSHEREIWDKAPKMQRDKADKIVNAILLSYKAMESNDDENVRSLRTISADLMYVMPLVQTVFDLCLSLRQKDFWRDYFEYRRYLKFLKTKRCTLNPLVLRHKERIKIIAAYLTDKIRQFESGEIAKLPSYNAMAADFSKDSTNPISHERVRILMWETLGNEGMKKWKEMRKLRNAVRVTTNDIEKK